MYNHFLYFSYWLTNSAVLYVFYLLFGDNIILGNWRFGPIESAIYAGFWATFLLWSFWDFALAKGVKFDNYLTTLGYFLLVNAFSFWLVSRFSQYAGFGITGYGWAFALALAAHFLQRGVRRMIIKGNK